LIKSKQPNKGSKCEEFKLAKTTLVRFNNPYIRKLLSHDWIQQNKHH